MNNQNLNFHQTFYPNLSYISKILRISNNENGMTKEEISEETGIPTGCKSGKVEPHLEYAKYMNLINIIKQGNKYFFNRTSLGEKVYLEDPSILEVITKKLLHYFLTSKIKGAYIWNCFIREIPEKYGFEISEILLKKELEQATNKVVKLTALKSSYNHDDSFQILNFVSINNISKKTNYVINNLYYSNEEKYMYIYCLLAELESIDPLRLEFDFNEIFEYLKWHRGFGMSKESIFKVIENLELEGEIQINRQLYPVTIVLNNNSKYYLEKLYELLI